MREPIVGHSNLRSQCCKRKRARPKSPLCDRCRPLRARKHGSSPIAVNQHISPGWHAMKHCRSARRTVDEECREGGIVQVLCTLYGRGSDDRPKSYWMIRGQPVDDGRIPGWTRCSLRGLHSSYSQRIAVTMLSSERIAFDLIYVLKKIDLRRPSAEEAPTACRHAGLQGGKDQRRAAPR